MVSHPFRTEREKDGAPATTPDERLTSEFLAISIGTNAVVIRRLLASLRRAGLVTSKSAGGSLALNRPIIWTIAGFFAPASCIEPVVYSERELASAMQ